MKALIYIRVSTLEQAKEGYSIGTQKKRLMAYAQSQDWDIQNVYVDDGYSAKDLNRPDMQRMIQDIKENQNDELVVLVFKLDRMTRSVLDLYKLLDIFEEHKTKFKSATEVYDTTTAMGRLFITLVAALAQWERENLSERVKVNMEEMVMGGNWHGGNDPLGYEWNGKELVIVPSEAKIVKEIFDLYLEGKSDHVISKYINTRGYLTKKDSPFYSSTVSYILKNPIYKGSLRWHLTSDGEYFEVEDIVTPIINKEQFDAVQKLRESKSKLHPRQVNSNFIFSGKLVCGRCGRKLIGNTSKNGSKDRVHFHYHCPKQRIGSCNMPHLNELHIEKAFIDYLYVLEDELALNEIASTIDKSKSPIQVELINLNQELKKLKDLRKKWQFAFANDAMTIDDLRSRTAENNELEQKFKNRINEISNQDNSTLSMNKDDIIEIIKDIKSSWDEADRKNKKSMIQILIDFMEIDTPDSIGTRRKRNEMRKINFSKIEFN